MQAAQNNINISQFTNRVLKSVMKLNFSIPCGVCKYLYYIYRLCIEKNRNI